MNKAAGARVNEITKCCETIVAAVKNTDGKALGALINVHCVHKLRSALKLLEGAVQKKRRVNGRARSKDKRL